jgi:hypothetical protein
MRDGDPNSMNTLPDSLPSYPSDSHHFLNSKSHHDVKKSRNFLAALFNVIGIFFWIFSFLHKACTDGPSSCPALSLCCSGVCRGIWNNTAGADSPAGRGSAANSTAGDDSIACSSGTL